MMSCQRMPLAIERIEVFSPVEIRPLVSRRNEVGLAKTQRVKARRQEKIGLPTRQSRQIRQVAQIEEHRRTNHVGRIRKENEVWMRLAIFKLGHLDDEQLHLAMSQQLLR